MKTEAYIAWRYLIAKKGHNAIHVVTAVSAIAVAVVTAAMVCVLSVMNGFGALVESMFSQFDPDLRITPTTGKVLDISTEAMQKLRTMDEIAIWTPTIEETALVSFNDQQVPALIKGVDSTFAELTNIDSIMFDGRYSVRKGDIAQCVPGVGLAGNLGLKANFISPVHIYAPRRTGRLNPTRPDQSFVRRTMFISGIFAVNQVKYDNSYMLVSLDEARVLFEYPENEASAVELRLDPKTNIRKLKKQIRELGGDRWTIADRYEQQADFYRILRIEKFLTAVLLVFILLIASFNVIGSLSMLIIDKQNDIRILSDLGASEKMIRTIFLMEGWLISILGATGGLILGLLLSFGQQQFGWLKLGTGEEYIISAYPVDVQALDILIVGVVVLALGWLVAWIPTRKIKGID